MADPYIDPATGLLRNSLGIVDAEALERAEADASAARLYTLARQVLPGSYDLVHLQLFHQRIFGDIYPWAGQVRTVELAKGPYFCAVQHLDAYAADIFGRLREANYMRGLTRDEFSDAVAALYGDVNALHPFREGNGRAQRAFLGQLARHAGHRIAWERLDRASNDHACLANRMNGDDEPLRKLMRELVDA